MCVLALTCLRAASQKFVDFENRRPLGSAAKFGRILTRCQLCGVSVSLSGLYAQRKRDVCQSSTAAGAENMWLSRELHWCPPAAVDGRISSI